MKRFSVLYVYIGMTYKEIYESKRPIGKDDDFSYWQERMTDYLNMIGEMGFEEFYKL